MIYICKYYTKINKEQWRDVAYYINTDANDGDLILFNAGYTQLPFNYYSKRTDLIKKPFPKIGKQVNEENIKELEPTVEGHRRVWVILSHSRDEKELISKKLIEAYSFWFQKEYTGIKLYFFEKRE